jgi:DNA-binding LacI/PurR family transcriptional regulator
VTVRLALGDLENRGLIYRKHGKGTFAHGRATRLHRYLGILIRGSGGTDRRPIAELIRGAQSVMSDLKSGILLISTSPANWLPEKASSLGGVIVIPDNITGKELDILKDRNLPYLIFSESDLPGPRIMLGQRKAARHMTEQLLKAGHRRLALLSGYDSCLDAPKRLGIHDALREAGIDPASVPDFSTKGQEGEIFEAARNLLNTRPRPTGVIAFDDSHGSILSFLARRQEKLNVPEDLSIVSFHDWPYLKYIEPALSTVSFEFYTAGQRAADALAQASLTGGSMVDLDFEPLYRSGQTIGPARSDGV